jgi:hypothetical protein
MRIGKALLVLGCAALFGTDVPPAFAADPPLFAAFRQFCADTQAKPDAVKAAALAASSKNVASAATDKKSPASAAGSSWSLVYQGHHLSVTSGTLQTPAAGNMPATNSITCAIADSDGDNAGASATAAWASVPASAEIGGVFGTYTYQEKNGKHVPVKAVEKAVKDPQGVWNLTLSQIGKVTAVNLAHATAAKQ